jgi:DNA-binding MarR family transcriptional regulator
MEDGRSTEMMGAFAEWARSKEGARSGDFRSHVHNVAQARHVIRRIFRIVDEQARQVGLEPLEHQALLQIYCAPDDTVSVNRVAERVDIAPAFASRLIRELEGRGLVRRSRSQSDRRVITVTATEEGVQLLQAIDDAIHLHVAYFQQQLPDAERFAALAIFASYVGLASDSLVAEALRTGVRSIGGFS